MHYFHITGAMIPCVHICSYVHSSGMMYVMYDVCICTITPWNVCNNTFL